MGDEGSSKAHLPWVEASLYQYDYGLTHLGEVKVKSEMAPPTLLGPGPWAGVLVQVLW